MESMAPRRAVVKTPGGVECSTWTWQPSSAVHGLVVLFHGLGSHARFPSTSLAAEVLSARGFAVVSPDMPGHGESHGLRGFIYSCDELEADAIHFAQHARAAHPSLPLFLAGSSMGGAIAFRVAQSLEGVRGVVLLAPMLAPPASDAVRHLLGVLSYTPLCRLALIPSSATDNAKQCADPQILAQVERDELAYKEPLRVGSVSSLLELGARCEASLAQLRCPFFCLLAEREMVLSPAARAAAERLMVEAATPLEDRLLRRYDALHGLLCEPEPLRSTIVNDIVAWLDKLCSK
ncbi:hypothetical protein AB1Y20_009968 [Prymnesium parvum]|uniref:Serine aminopeptidase S33 domain-containing protein n=1 Tax=Prymnesium parvum TaxID=97485 RepID=A0AB34K317_PRYPA